MNSPPKKAMRTINTESIILLPLDLAVVLITLTTCAVSVFAFGGMLHAGMSAPDYYSQRRACVGAGLWASRARGALSMSKVDTTASVGAESVQRQQQQWERESQ